MQAACDEPHAGGHALRCRAPPFVGSMDLMTRHWFAGAVLAATLLAPGAAQAADQTITVGTGDQRVVCTTNCATVQPGTAADVTVNVGDTVHWTYATDSVQDHHIQSDLQAGSGS